MKPAPILSACALTWVWTALVIGQAIDGSDNNLSHPEWGTPGQQLLRRANPAYGDGVSSPAGDDRPGPREISNAVVAGPEDGPVLDQRNLSAWTFAWGQFIDHDLDLTVSASPPEPYHIPIPKGDIFFDPNGLGNQIIPLNRSIFDPATGTGKDNPRQQINLLTAYMDGSMVYGSTLGVSNSLREFAGGRLKTSGDRLMPVDAGGNFLAGDVRANENIFLSSVHILFVREHNRLCAELASRHPGWDANSYSTPPGPVSAP